MKSELFVINSIKASQESVISDHRAFSAVAEHFPALDAPALLRILQNERRLKQEATRMQVEYNQVFAQLEQAIIAAFNRQAAVRLTRHHVQLLLNTDVQSYLAPVLGCAPQHALQTLLSIDDLQATLADMTNRSVTSLPDDAMQLLSELLKPSCADKLQREHNTSEDNWGRIFKEEAWLLPAGLAALKRSTLVQTDREAIQALAGLIDKCQEEEDRLSIGGPKDVIKPLSLLHLRRRIAGIIGTINGQAVEYAENAAISMPGSPAMRVAVALIQIYGLGSIAAGLDAYINYTRPLRELLPKEGVETFGVEPGSAVRGRALEFSGDRPYTVAGEQVANFEIKVHISTQRKPHPILRVRETPMWLYHQLKRDIPRLTADDLFRIGGDLAERLLNTSFPLIASEELMLREAIDQLGLRFVQAVALVAERPIVQVPAPWLSEQKFRLLYHGQLDMKVSEFRLPYRDLPAKADPLFLDVESIVEQYRREYAGQRLEIVYGFAQADSAAQNTDD